MWYLTDWNSHCQKVASPTHRTRHSIHGYRSEKSYIRRIAIESVLRCVKAASSAFAMEWRDQAERKTCYAWCNEKRRLGNVVLKVRLENHGTEAKLVGLIVEQLTYHERH